MITPVTPRQRSRRALRGAAAVVALTLGLAACSGGPGQQQEEEPIGGLAEISVFSPQDAEGNLAENLFTKKMEEKFNIKFTWETTTYDGGPAAEKRNISLASGDYPDLYLLIPWVDQFRPVDLQRLGQQGVAVPLNDLIAEHGPNIQAALDAHPEYKAMATAPDGQIYGIPQWVDCYHCSYSGKLWMNSEWLEKVGMEQPTTTDEMLEVLRAFKTQDPNGNGKADEVPLSADVRDDLIPYFMNSFIYNPQGTSGNNKSTLVLNDGRVDIQANKDGWREGLRYIKTMWDEGLIDKGAFTQNSDALQQVGDNAGVNILGSSTVMHPYIFVSGGNPDGRDKQYDAVPPLKGPKGVAFTPYVFPSNPGATFMLTNKATKNEQVAAIKMLDYIFTTEGELAGHFGEKGVDWEEPGPDDKPLDPTLEPLYKLLEQPEGSEPRNASWGAMAQYNNTAEFRNAQVVPTDIYSTEGYERRLFEATKLYEGKEDKNSIYPFWRVWVEPSDATEVAQTQTNLDNYIAQNALAFITGSKNIDTEWDAYLQGFEGLQLNRYLEIQQAAYDKTANR